MTDRLRTKILLAVAGVVLFICAAAIVFVKTVLFGYLAENLQSRGVSLATRLAEATIDPIVTEHDFDLAMMVRDYKDFDNDVSYIFIVDPRGRILAHTFGTAFPAELREINPVARGSRYSVRRIATGEGNIRDVAIPLSQGRAGVLHLGMSEEAIRKDIGDFVSVIVYFFIAVSAAGGLLGVVVSRIMTKPIEELSEAARAVAGGDLGRRVAVRSRDEVGRLAVVFNEMIESRQKAEADRDRVIGELQDALKEVKVLSGFLPICSGCKKIRDDHGYWSQVEEYIGKHSEAQFSHGLCPDCAKSLFPQYGAAPKDPPR